MSQCGQAGKALEATAEWMSCARRAVSSVHDLNVISKASKLMYFYQGSDRIG